MNSAPKSDVDFRFALVRLALLDLVIAQARTAEVFGKAIEPGLSADQNDALLNAYEALDQVNRLARQLTGPPGAQSKTEPSRPAGARSVRWTSLELAAPPLNSRVLICERDGSVDVAVYTGLGEFRYDGGVTDYLPNVTHWQPLPAPPAE